jgi:hypothetical protein
MFWHSSIFFFIAELLVSYGGYPSFVSLAKESFGRNKQHNFPKCYQIDDHGHYGCHGEKDGTGF